MQNLYKIRVFLSFSVLLPYWKYKRASIKFIMKIDYCVWHLLLVTRKSRRTRHNNILSFSKIQFMKNTLNTLVSWNVIGSISFRATPIGWGPYIFKSSIYPLFVRIIFLSFCVHNQRACMHACIAYYKRVNEIWLCLCILSKLTHISRKRSSIFARKKEKMIQINIEVLRVDG